MPAPTPTQAPSIPAEAILPTTQALFDGYVRDNKMPGIVGAFGYAELPTLYVAAGSIADGPAAPAAGPDSLWRVYSMTKPVTALAAMILIEEGKLKLKLDEPLATYIPAFRNMRVLTDPDTSLASRPATRPITVRNLLTHTAGLGYTIVTKGPLLKEYERLGITPGQVDARIEAEQRAARPASLEAFADRLATLPLIAEPGTKWSYSVALDLMGRVIEVAAKMPFDCFVQQRIFDPLAMRSSYWTVPASEAGRLATDYYITGDHRTPIDPGATSIYLAPPSFPYGGAGLVMSARDYDIFLHLLQDGGALNGVRIVRPETAALMMSNLLPPGVVFGGRVTGGGTAPAAAGLPTGYGAGGFVFTQDGPGGWPGKGSYGWGGAAGTAAFVDPVHKARATVMVNYIPGDSYPVRDETIAAMVKDLSRFAPK